MKPDTVLCLVSTLGALVAVAVLVIVVATSPQRTQVRVECTTGSALIIRRAGHPPPTPTPDAMAPILGGAGVLQGTSAPTIAQRSIAKNMIIPLFWQSVGFLYQAHFIAGASPIVAAFDTGSTNFIVASTSTSPTNSYNSSTGTPVRSASGAACVNTVNYVSQSNTVQVFLDTLAFPTKIITGSDLCTTGVTQVVLRGSAAKDFTLSQFPVGATIKSTGASSMNVLGMSPLQAASVPSVCKTFSAPAFVSPVIQSFAEHNAGTTPPTDVIWSMMLGTPAADSTLPAGFMVFGPMGVPCLTPVVTPMVPSLPSAPGLGGTPFQYYVVEVEYCAIGTTGAPVGSYSAFPGFPKYLLVDSGTTLALIPGGAAASTCAAINGVTRTQTVILVLKNGVTITYQPADVVYEVDGGREPVFAAMDDATAANFSTSRDVGILGCTALRNLYVEFNLTKKTIGFAQVRN